MVDRVNRKPTITSEYTGGKIRFYLALDKANISFFSGPKSLS